MVAAARPGPRTSVRSCRGDDDRPVPDRAADGRGGVGGEIDATGDADEPGARRGAGRRPGAVWLATLLLALVGALWTVAQPQYRAPDEAAHVDLVLHLAEGHPYPSFDGRRFGEEIGLDHDRHLIDLTIPWPRFDEADAPRGRPAPTSTTSAAPTPTPMPAGWAPTAPPGRATRSSTTRCRSTRRSTTRPWRPCCGSSAGSSRATTGRRSTARSPCCGWSTWRCWSRCRSWPGPSSGGWAGTSAPAPVAALLPLCVPQLTHVGAAVNNDNLFALLGAGLAVVLAGVARGRRSRATDVGVGVLLGLALLTKAFAVMFVPWVVARLRRGLAHRAGAATRRGRRGGGAGGRRRRRVVVGGELGAGGRARPHDREPDPHDRRPARRLLSRSALVRVDVRGPDREPHVGLDRLRDPQVRPARRARRRRGGGRSWWRPWPPCATRGRPCGSTAGCGGSTSSWPGCPWCSWWPSCTAGRGACSRRRAGSPSCRAATCSGPARRRRPWRPSGRCACTGGPGSPSWGSRPCSRGGCWRTSCGGRGRAMAASVRWRGCWRGARGRRRRSWRWRSRPSS